MIDCFELATAVAHGPSRRARTEQSERGGVAVVELRKERVPGVTQRAIEIADHRESHALARPCIDPALQRWQLRLELGAVAILGVDGTRRAERLEVDGEQPQFSGS